MQAKPLDLRNLLENLFKMLSRLVGEVIALELVHGAGDVWIEGDPGMIEQVTVNLVVNARDAMPSGGRLEVSVEETEVGGDLALSHLDARPGRFARLKVVDTGTGMDAAVLARLFEPFFTTKEVGKGTGLGLATAYGIVKQHRGWIEVDSLPGRGTTFRVYLPVCDPPAAVNPMSPMEPQPPRGDETILLVEDEEAVRRVTAQYLRRQGYKVVEACNGVEALRRWEEQRGEVALLLTDMVMPGGLTGLDLARQLRVRKRGLEVIIASGYSAELLEQGDQTAREMSYASKPYAPTVLARTIRDCLDRKSRP